MAQIHLRIADLRRQKKVTQQELADRVGVSYQTVSRWETGAGEPELSLLAILAEYFQVSVDQLLGLTPLEGEIYVPERTGTRDFWNQKREYLLRTRKDYYNEDYVEFLVKRVWKLEGPVSLLDCGCGYGFLGLLLMPYLAEGSTYTGIDFAEELIATGREIFQDRGLEGEFIQGDVFAYEGRRQYDVVICQAVLRHLDNPEEFIRKMIQLTRPGGYVICIDANREFECDGLYIDGMDYQVLCRHDGLEKKWRMELEKQGRDYAVAIRTAHIMRRLGLQDVDVRMNDRVELVTPEKPEYEEKKRDFLDYNDWNTGLNDEEREQVILHLLSHGLDRREAQQYCDRNRIITGFFRENQSAGYTFVKGHMITYGKKSAVD